MSLKIGEKTNINAEYFRVNITSLVRFLKFVSTKEKKGPQFHWVRQKSSSVNYLFFLETSNNCVLLFQVQQNSLRTNLMTSSLK